MSKNPIEQIQSPVSELEWVIIDGEGKEDLQGNMKFQAQLVLDGDKAEKFKEETEAFWEANRPKHIKEAKSLGFMPHKVLTDEVDEDGNKVYEETGKTAVIFKTGTEYNDGKPKVVKVFNAKGKEVDLKGKKIGNESRGRINGARAIYTVESKGKVIQAGVTHYLNAIQLAKFVEYVGGPRFDEMPDDEADFDGVDDDGMDSLDERDTAQDTNEKPKL